MAIVTFPLNNTDYTADDMALYFSNRTNGVFSADSELSTISNNNMTVTVKSGRAWLAPDAFKGYIFASMSDEVLNIDIADGVLNRIDRVVIKYDIVANISTLYIKKGVPNTNPTAPVLTRDKNIAWELAIADIYIGKGVTSIRPQDITDKRLDSSVCGLVSDGINKIATDVLYNQFQDWFLHLRNELDENQVTNLQNQIDTWNDFKTNGGEIGGALTINGTIYSNNRIDNYANDSDFTIALKENKAIVPEDIYRGSTLGSAIKPFDNIYLSGVYKNVNGYTKLPNGMIMQWGRSYLHNISSSEYAEIAFPIAFPTEHLSIQTTIDSTDYGRTKVANGRKNGFRLYIEGSNSTSSVFWFAIGY